MKSFEEMINRFPEEIIKALKNLEQNEKYHKEGSVYNHIKLVFNNLEDNDLKIAALFHDLGKLDATRKNEKGNITSIGHEIYSKDYIKKYNHLFPEAKDWNKISTVCSNHMRAHLYKEKVMRKQKLEEFEKMPYFSDIMEFEESDSNAKK